MAETSSAADRRAKVLRSTRNLALWNGGSIVVIALLGGLLSLPYSGLPGLGVGLAIASAGALELYGRSRLAAAPALARRWLCGAEVWLFCLICAYAIWRLQGLDPASVLDSLGPEIVDMLHREMLAIYGFRLPDEILADSLVQSLQLVYRGLIAGSAIYQGLMFVRYYRATRELEHDRSAQ